MSAGLNGEGSTGGTPPVAGVTRAPKVALAALECVGTHARAWPSGMAAASPPSSSTARPAHRNRNFAMPAYPDTLLLIDGSWRPAASGRTIPVVNPATGQAIGTVAWADRSDLDAALAAAAQRLRGLAQDLGL